MANSYIVTAFTNGTAKTQQYKSVNDIPADIQARQFVQNGHDPKTNKIVAFGFTDANGNKMTIGSVIALGDNAMATVAKMTKAPVSIAGNSSAGLYVYAIPAPAAK